MKVMILIFILTLAQSTQAEASDDLKSFTPLIVEDSYNMGKKGAAQIVWKRSHPQDQYEVQVSNGERVYSDVVDKNFKHVMLYFNKKYKWRVRKVSRKAESEYSPWFSVKVVKKSWAGRASLAQELAYGEVEELFVDHGAD